MGSNVPTKKKKPRSRARRISEWTAALTVATLLLTISVVALIVLGSDIASAIGLNKVPYLSTTLAIIFGTTTLISFLTVATIMFFRLRLTDRGEALGLPQGSVRALIALILIVIFAIMVIYMYADLKVKPLTYPNGTYMTDENGTILYEPQPLDSQIDFGKQVLTTVSTLVVAVAGFYFGAKSAKPPSTTEEVPKLLISPSGSIKLAKNKTQVINVDTTPDDEKVNWDIDPPSKGSIVLKDGDYEFAPLGASENDIIKLKCSLAKYPKTTKQLEITITAEE